MPSTYLPGAFTQNQFQGSVRTPIYGVAAWSFVNRTPLFTRLPQVPLGAMSFKTSTTLYRPYTGTITNGAAVTSGLTTFVVADASVYQPGDTIEALNTAPAYEEMLITAVVPSTNTLTVVRSYAGTTAGTVADGSTIYLLSNTRTGGEVNQTGISRIPTLATQWSQTFQHPYHVGGALNACTDFALPPGVVSVVGREKMGAIQNCSDDVERACYYGRPVPIVADTDRPAMGGLRYQLATNNVVAPTSYSAYKASDLIRDTIARGFANGGSPDVLLVPAEFQYAATIWGSALVRTEAGATKYGVAIDVFEAPFLNGVDVIPCPLLRPGTYISLTSAEVRMRVKRNMFDKPRGSTGDADQGDVIFDGALEVDNEHHHAFVSGITGYSAT